MDAEPVLGTAPGTANRDHVLTARLGERLEDIFVVPREHFQALETETILDLNWRAFGICFGSIVDPLSIHYPSHSLKSSFSPIEVIL